MKRIGFLSLFIWAVFVISGCGGSSGNSTSAPSDPLDANATFVFGNDGFIDYILTSVSDAALGTAGTADPTITLLVGSRYTMTVTSYTFHPIELITQSSGAEADTVLLSMGSTVGSFESDTAVDFQNDGAGTIAFTLTQALADLLDGYRCANHPDAMRGNILTP